MVEFIVGVAMAIIPYLTGVAVSIAIGRATRKYFVCWALGMSTLLTTFLAIDLVALKLDMNLGRLASVSRIVGGIFTAIGLLALVISIIWSFRASGKKSAKRRAADVSYIPGAAIPTVILGVIAVLLTNRYLGNDITIETVKTIVGSDELYTYSALTGRLMENGLPIWNKIQVIPVLYAVIVKISGIDVAILTTYICPILIFTVAMGLFYEIAVLLTDNRKSATIMYWAELLMLICGTYLPQTQIPTTAGFPILRQGFTSYAFAYGVVVPVIVILWTNKRKLAALLCATALLGLIKLDTLMFMVISPKTSLTDISLSGKLAIIYVIAAIYYVCICRQTTRPINLSLFLSGTILFAYSFADFITARGKELKKSQKAAFTVSIAVALWACSAFRPFAGATAFSKSLTVPDTDAYVWNEICQMSQDRTTVWATRSLTDSARRYSGNLMPIYGRQLGEPLLDGNYYEDKLQGEDELKRFMDMAEGNFTQMNQSNASKLLRDNEALKLVEIIVLPGKLEFKSRIQKELAEYGFDTEQAVKVSDWQILVKQKAELNK